MQKSITGMRAYGVPSGATFDRNAPAGEYRLIAFNLDTGAHWHLGDDGNRDEAINVADRRAGGSDTLGIEVVDEHGERVHFAGTEDWSESDIGGS